MMTFFALHKRNFAMVFAFIAVLFCTSLMAPSPAHAAEVLNLDNCAPEYQFDDRDYTAKVVICIRKVIIGSVNNMLALVSVYMNYTVGVILLFSMAIFGMKVMAGESQIKSKAMGYLIKLSFVWVFSYNLGGLGQIIYDVMDEIIYIAIGGYSPWGRMDMYLGKLLGFAPGFALFQGMVGIVGAALFSGSMGVTLFATGFLGIMNLILFIFDIVYAYLTALLVIGFLIVLSPFFVPLVLFQYTERYFKQWLNTILSCMLLPVLLFAFLAMTMDVFSILISSIFQTLGGNQFEHFWKVDQPPFAWLMPTDPNLMQRLQDIVRGIEEDPRRTPPVGTFINPFSDRAFNANPFFPPGIHFGLDNLQRFIRLIYTFLALWIYASVIKNVIRKLPEIANAITQGVSGISVQGMPFKQRMAEAVDNFKTGAGFMAGGFVGGQVGRAAGGARLGQAGAAFGGAIGAMLARR